MTNTPFITGFQTEEESDALRELGNVAFSHAATALSTLVGRRVDLSMPNVRVVEARSVEDSLSAAEEPMYIITLRVLGERQGTLALMFAEHDALALTNMLEGVPSGTRTRLTREMANVLQEVANVMSGSALLAMYRLLRVNLIHGMPTLHVQTHAAAPDSILHLGGTSEICILVEAEFEVQGERAHGVMVISLGDLRFFLDALLSHEGV